MSKKRINTVTGKKESDPSILNAQKKLSKLHKQDIEEGNVPDLEEINIQSHISSAPAIQKLYPSLPKDYYQNYEKYIDRNIVRGRQWSIEDLNQMRAENQSHWDQAGNALGRIGTNIIPEILSGIASVIDVPGWFDAEEAANNSIVKWADEWKKRTNEEWFPIYQEAEGEFMQLGDPAWWFDRGSSLTTSILSYLALGSGLGKLVPKVFQTIGSATKGKDLTRAILGAKNKAKGITRSKQVLDGMSGLGTAALLNQSEAVLEATQVYQDTYENALASGESTKDAKRKASAAAATTMNINRLNILLNLSSAKAFITPNSYIRQLVKAPSIGKSLGLTTLEGGKEAMEELINHVASKAGMAKGEGKKYTFQDALNDMGTMEGFEAAFLGALGGIGQTGGTQVLKHSKYGPGSTTDEDGNRISYVQNQRDKYAKQQEVINEMKENGVRMNDAMKSVKEAVEFTERLSLAIENGDQAAFDTLKEEMFENLAFKAFESGTTEILENLFEEEANKNVEEVGEEHIERAKTAIKNLKELENIYINHEDYTNADEIFYNRANKIRLDRNKKMIQQQKQSVAFEYSDQVKDIASQYEMEREREVLYKEEGEVTRTETVKYTEPLTYTLQNIEENNEDSKANKTTYDKFLKEVQTLPTYEKLKQYNESLEKLNKTSIELEKNYEKITSPEYQAKAKKEQDKKRAMTEALLGLPKNSSISDIEKLKAKFNDEAFNKKADERISGIKANKGKTRQSKKEKSTASKISDEIKNAEEKDIENFRKEINSAEIDPEDRALLHKELDERVRVLNGEPVDPDAESESASNFSSAFQPSDPDSEEETILDPKLQEIPNSNTELTEVMKEVNKVVKKLSEKDKTLTVTVDENGNVQYEYIRTDEGHNRAAYQSRPFLQIDTEGNVVREEYTDEINNKHLLDPNGLLPGTKIYFKVKEDYEGDIYVEDSTEKEVSSWQEKLLLIKQKEGDNYRNSAEYRNSVPIVAVNEAGEELFYMHETNWIKEENIENSTNNIGVDKAKLIKMREAVIKKGPVGVETTITFKGNGFLLKTASGENVVLAEAMPDRELVLAIGKDGAYKMHGNPERRLDGGNKSILNKEKPKNGRLYAMLPIGPKQTIAIPLTRKNLHEKAQTSIIQAIKLYLEGDANNSVVQEIANKSSIDITTWQGLKTYIKQFVYLTETDKDNPNLLEEMLSESKGTFNSAVPLLSIGPTGIEFGRPGINSAASSKGEKRVGVISKNFKNNQIGLKSLENILGKMLANADMETLQLDQNVLLINEENKVDSIEYTSYLKEVYETNILGVQIGDEQSPKWAYTIQPTILFDTGFADLKGLKVEVQKKSKKGSKPDTIKKATNVAKRQAVSSKKESDSTKQVKEKYETLLKKELQQKLAERGIKYTTKETKAQLIEKLKEDDLNKKTSSEAESTSTFNSEEFAKELLTLDWTLEKLENLLEAAINKEATLSELTQENFIEGINKAIEIFKNNSSEENTTTKKLANGQTVKIDKNTKDDPDIDEAPYEDSLPTLTEEQWGKQSQTLEKSVIKGISPRLQHSLLSYYSSRIIKASLNKLESTGKSTVNVEAIFDSELKSLNQMAKFYEETGLTNKAKRIRKVISQFDKIKILTNQKLSLISNGDTSNIESENQEGAELERKYYSDDWTFTVDSKKTASANLRRFFASVSDLDENGDAKLTILGTPEIIPFDIVYNTLHEILANKPADLDTMISVLEMYKEKYSWISSIIEQLKNAPHSIKNEFVSDMAKHSIDMKFIMWGKNPDGSYTLQSWESNATAKKFKLLSNWQSNLRGIGTSSNLVSLDEESGRYVYNTTIVKKLVEQAEIFKKNPDKVTFEELANWLGELGIILSDQTYKDLKNSKYKNKKRLNWKDLFTDSDSFVTVLTKSLKKKLATNKVFVDTDILLKDTAIKQLAKLEAENTLNVFNNSFNAGKKQIYSYSNNNNLINRMRDLTSTDEEGNLENQELIEQLKQTIFVKDSLWLQELADDTETSALMKEQLKISYVSLEALKKRFTKSKDKRKLNNLSVAEHEITKLGHFFSGATAIVDGKLRRKVSFFYPTISDKSTMMLVDSLAHKLEANIVNGELVVSDEILDLMFDSIVLPEINRIKFASHTKQDIKGYEPKHFYFLTSLNEFEVLVEEGTQTLSDYIFDGNKITDDIKERIKEDLRDTLNDLTERKVQDWNKLGIGLIDSKNKIINSFIDKEYMQNSKKNGIPGTGPVKVRFAAMDFVFNSLIANAEMFKLFAGDPALYAKSENGIVNLDKTFVNLGKRLASEIAPGIELANSVDEVYTQVFLADTKTVSNNVKDPVQKEYFNKIIKSYSKDYSDIEGSDAQEYTTWREHLRVLDGLGRLTKKQYGEIYDALENDKELTYEQLGLVLQPIKPVYSGNQVINGVDRRIYIKSSSFPLIPQLTKGLEIDKIREGLEIYEKKTGLSTRASFGTANKVGSTKNELKVFNEDGTVVDGFEISEENSLTLERKNFRIQLDVPYKREKNKVNIGSQERKLLFSNILDVEISDGVTGKALYKEYVSLYEDLFVHAKEKLKEKLGLDANNNIPANKLQAILIKEIKSRQGYPENMIHSLELNEEGTDFKIPLWSSPYASKFESILISIVNKGVVRQKFPGHSYVLGSDGGFLIAESEEGQAKLKESGIVFSKNFDAEKGLQPIRYDKESGKILPAQIMIPFKFRDELGNILNIKDFTTIDENGRTIIDTEKIPEKVLTQFGFRIPTQGHNSMSAIEIVGFLPEMSGDLILAPRDFTKQMGSDFDVDKLYTYMYNTYYQDGKLHTDFEKDLDKIEARREEVLKQLKITKEQELELRELHTGDENVKEVLKEISSKNKKELVAELIMLNKSYVASRQNAIIDIHTQIMTSTNPEVLQSILALDSPGEFKQLSEDIREARIVQQKINEPSTILSDEYQRTKYVNATAGKDGVGVLSLDSTLNAVLQGKEIALIQFNPREEKVNPKSLTLNQILSYNGNVVTFGELVSNGDLSSKHTLEGSKTKAEIIRNLQSAAVDNENEQILDKLNINNETYDAIRALTILGFGEKEIVGLLTQDIIWEFVEEVKNRRAGLFGYVPDVLNLVRNELAKKYDPTNKLENLTENIKNSLANISGDELIDIVKNKTLEVPGEKSVATDSQLQQILLLDKFLALSEIGTDLKVLQSSINSDKEIPNNLIEVNFKIEQIDTLGDNSTIYNASNLLGVYENGELVEPTTINGFASIHGTKFANEIFSKYFPYDKSGVQAVIKEISSHLPAGDEMSLFKRTELANNTFKAIRSYLFSNIETGLFAEATADSERRRLFIDRKGHLSLASILNNLSQQPWFINNGFLNKLDFVLESDGKISRIFFENAAGEAFDESNIYTGFASLMSENFVVGTFNGVEYTTRMLGQELIMAAFLEGATENSKQYLKYIPTTYLLNIELGDYLRASNLDFNTTFKGVETLLGTPYHLPSVFTRQYIQNNPQEARQIQKEDILNFPKDGKYPAHFTIKKEAQKNYMSEGLQEGGEGDLFMGQTPTHFLSIYDTSLPGKAALYEYSTETKMYHKIDVLADDYGFSQYNSEDRNVISVYAKSIAESVPQSNPKTTRPPERSVKRSETPKNRQVNNEKSATKLADLDIDFTLAGLNGTNDAFLNIMNALYTSKDLSSYNRALIDELQKYVDIEAIKVKYVNEPSGGEGQFDHTTDTVIINLARVQNFSMNELARVVFHETIHGFSSKTINAFERGDFLEPEVRATVQKLKDLQQQYMGHLVSKGNLREISRFNEKYWNWKYNRGEITKEQLDKYLAEGPQFGTAHVIPEGESFTKEEISKYYGAIRLSEFVTMALTDVGFQQMLNEVTVEDNVPFFSKLLEALINMLNTLGLNIEPNSVLAHTVEASLKLMESQHANMLKEQELKNQSEAFEFPYVEHGTEYYITGLGNEAFEGHYRQGNGEWKKMNPNKLQKTYERLAAKKALELTTNVKPTTQPQATDYDIVFNDGTVISTGMIRLNEQQKTALLEMGDFIKNGYSSDGNSTFTLSGYAGTGKTTILRILKEYIKTSKIRGRRIQFSSPTHRANAVMKSKGIDNINTIHKLLGLQGNIDTEKYSVSDVKFIQENAIKMERNGIVIIDESSFINDALFDQIIKTAKKRKTQIIFVGDPAQLNPVKQERISKAFTSADKSTELTKVERTGNNPLLAESMRVRTTTDSEPFSKRTAINEEGEGVKFTSDQSEFLNEIMDLFESEEFKTNPLLVRAVAHTNSRVTDLNDRIREGIWGANSDNEYNVGEILMGYSNWDTDFYTGIPKIANGGDYIVTNVVATEKTYTLFEGKVTVQGFDLVIKDLIDENADPINIFVLSKNTPENARRMLADHLEALRQIAKKAPKGKQRSAAWNMFYDFEKSIVSTQPLVGSDGRDKIRATIKYGYAHTIHKSQGGTYTYSFIDDTNIESGFATKESKRRLKYVGVTRAEKRSIILTDNITETKPLDIKSIKQRDPATTLEDSEKNGNTVVVSDEELLQRDFEKRMREKDDSLIEEAFINFKKICK